MSRMLSGVRSTRAREVIISLTYNEVAPLAPPCSSPSRPYSRHSRRKARLVMPAIGARTTGDSMVWRPICNGGSSGVAVGLVWEEVTAVMARPVSHLLLDWPNECPRQRRRPAGRARPARTARPARRPVEPHRDARPDRAGAVCRGAPARRDPRRPRRRAGRSPGAGRAPPAARGVVPWRPRCGVLGSRTTAGSWSTTRGRGSPLPVRGGCCAGSVRVTCGCSTAGSPRGSRPVARRRPPRPPSRWAGSLHAQARSRSSTRRPPPRWLATGCSSMPVPPNGSPVPPSRSTRSPATSRVP